MTMTIVEENAFVTLQHERDRALETIQRLQDEVSALTRKIVELERELLKSQKAIESATVSMDEAQRVMRLARSFIEGGT